MHASGPRPRADRDSRRKLSHERQEARLTSLHVGGGGCLPRSRRRTRSTRRGESSPPLATLTVPSGRPGVRWLTLAPRSEAVFSGTFRLPKAASEPRPPFTESRRAGKALDAGPAAAPAPGPLVRRIAAPDAPPTADVQQPPSGNSSVSASLRSRRAGRFPRHHRLPSRSAGDERAASDGVLRAVTSKTWLIFQVPIGAGSTQRAPPFPSFTATW